ncbi:MAG: chemotaxis protein CheX, partial [bacterium]|nr:chemotaxis protein CheX [bacterium]
TQFGMELKETEEILHPTSDTDRVGLMTGSIQITGAWSGAVHVYCTRQLIANAAAFMFAVEPEDLSEEDVRDALGELANMTAGNVKALLAHDSYVSLPTVVEGSDYDLIVLESTLLGEVSFTCEQQWLTVSVFESKPRE